MASSTSQPQGDVAEVVHSFREALEDLQRNDQYEIENLTMIAKEATEHAQAISQEVETHIRKTRPDYKLPGLYLLDSLVKNIGTPYTVYLGRNLYRIFFEAYTVVDNSTRRAMDELFRSWTLPLPDSRDPRPVFPAEVTRPIEAALIKMRGLDVRSREEVHIASIYSRIQQLPARVHPKPQPSRVSDSIDRNRASPAEHHHVRPEFFFQAPAPPHPTMLMNAPAFVEVSSAAARDNESLVVPLLDQTQPQNPSPYRYSGPPTPTMSHQSRLEKLRFDVRGLLDAAESQLSRDPYNPEKQKLLHNLRSLKGLLDTGSLSLTHIQSTEIVIANIAKDLQCPSKSPAHPTSFRMREAESEFNLSNIASIVARNSPRPTPTQYAESPAYSLPASAVSHTQPTCTNAYDMAMAGTPSSDVSASRMPTDLSQVIPRSAIAYPPAHALVPTNSLLDQLRSTGLLSGMPMLAEAPQISAAESDTAHQTLPRLLAQHDVGLDSKSLKLRRPQLARQLYVEKPDQCRLCGMRFSATDSGKLAKGYHIDWHFKVNTRLQDAMKQAANRCWYIDEREWIDFREALDGYWGTADDANPLGDGGLQPERTHSRAQFVFVPTDARLVNRPCPICQENFEQGWDESTQQPIWRDTLFAGQKYYHTSCYAEVQRGQSEQKVAEQRTMSSSARSTPDPILGKRRFDQFRQDHAVS